MGFIITLGFISVEASPLLLKNDTNFSTSSIAPYRIYVERQIFKSNGSIVKSIVHEENGHYTQQTLDARVQELIDLYPGHMIGDSPVQYMVFYQQMPE